MREKKKKRTRLQRKQRVVWRCESLLRTSLATLLLLLSHGARQLVKQAAGIRQASFLASVLVVAALRPAPTGSRRAVTSALSASPAVSARSSQLSELFFPFVSSSSLVCTQKGLRLFLVFYKSPIRRLRRKTIAHTN